MLRERGIVNLRELVRFEIEGLSVQLPAHKRILSYDISLEPLPRTTTGKIRRHEIERRVRERAAAPTPRRTADRQTTTARWLPQPAHAAALAIDCSERLGRPSRRRTPTSSSTSASTRWSASSC